MFSHFNTTNKKLNAAQVAKLRQMVQPQATAPVAVAAPIAVTTTSIAQAEVDTAAMNLLVTSTSTTAPAQPENDDVPTGVLSPSDQALLELASSGSVEMMLEILKDGADITIRDANNKTVLDILAATDQYQKLKAMLALYPKIDKEAKDLVSAYFSAISPEAKQLIANCMLTQAVKQDLAELAAVAIDFGAKPNQQDARGYTAQGLVEHYGHTNGLRFFSNSNDNNASILPTATSTAANKLPRQ